MDICASSSFLRTRIFSEQVVKASLKGPIPACTMFAEVPKLTKSCSHFPKMLPTAGADLKRQLHRKQWQILGTQFRS